MIEEDAENLDALVSVDLDETMISDFWADLRATVSLHPDFRHIYYLYAWNHDNEGNPKRVFWYDKVHPVKGCKWIHPVHEELVIDDPSRIGEYRLFEEKIYLHHWADPTKSRSSYLPLLEIRAQESPDDIYGLFYLMREHTFYDPNSLRALNIATEAYVRLTTKNQNIEDRYDCLPFFILTIADIYNGWGLKEDAEYYYKKALKVGSNLRQPYISYAMFAAYQGRYELVFRLLQEMEHNIPRKYSTWYECDYNWTWLPMQIKAVAYCWAGKYKKAKEIFEEAETVYIKTETDVAEARSRGFYADYQWLLDYLEKGESR